MMKGWSLRNVALIATCGISVLTIAALIAIAAAGPGEAPPVPTAVQPAASTDRPRQGDEELAYLLVRLELKTRSVIAGHYTRRQSALAPVNLLYKRWLTNNLILPAAVADNIFAEVVPQATSGRAWVKMVVDNPRNPNNRPDEVGKELLSEIKAGAPSAERRQANAYYYAEPIRSPGWCLRCHGEPAGEPDPSFPQFRKDGWKEGAVVGAVVARVAAGPRSGG